MKPASRELTYAAAIREGFAVALERDPRVLLMGLGVPDPKGFFGTTTDLQKQFGADRVMDMPCAENGMSGVMLGAALNGLRPVLNHQRLDFAMLSMDPICTQAAKCMSLLLSGSPPVSLNFLKPNAQEASTMRMISDALRWSAFFAQPLYPSGMQYRHRSLQRSVTEMRR